MVEVASSFLWNEKRRLTLEEAIAFHGHEGPWLIIGYKAGVRAVEILKPESISDLFCIVRTPLRIPFTCAIDGIQVATKCTLGKMNIRLKEVESAEDIEYVFICRRQKRKFKLKLKPYVQSRVEELFSNGGIIEASRWCERQEVCSLFEESLEEM